jgi:hypothetical protein
MGTSLPLRKQGRRLDSGFRWSDGLGTFYDFIIYGRYPLKGIPSEVTGAKFPCGIVPGERSAPSSRFRRRIDPVVAETAIGKPLFKASEGGRIDILREWEDITQSELHQGSGT